MELFKLVGSVLVDTDSANKSLNKTGEHAETLGTKLSNGITTAAKWGAAIGAAAVAVGTAAYGMASKTAEACDEIDKMSIKLGMSRTAYQEWDYVLSQAGVDINSLETGMKTLTNKIGDVTDATSFQKSAFAELGMSYEDIQGKSREEIFASTITALQNCSDETQRATLANDLFGKSGQNLAPLLASGAASTQELLEKARELGIVMSDETIDAGVEFTDTMDTLKRSFEAVGLEMFSDLMPMFTDLANWLIDTGIPKIKELKDKFNDLKDKMKEVKDWFEKNKLAIELLVAAISPLLVAMLAYKGYLLVCNMLIPIYNTITAIQTGLTTTLTAATWALNGAIGFLTSPIGLVIIAITAMVAVGVLLYKNWDTVKEKASALWDKIKSVFDGIKNTISDKINGAKDAVKKAIDAIKGFFNFSFKWPSIPMPHFKINPNGWKVGDLLKGKIPTLGVDFYAKAMDNPVALNGATMFGMNAKGQPMVGGETGTEYISGKEGIQEAVVEVLDRMDWSIQLDGREVGRLVKKYA